MFETLSQFCVFVACVGYGAISGIIFSMSSALKYVFNKKALGIVSDALSFFIVGGVYVYYSYALNFPSLRLYMPLGVLLGIYCYMKSFHIILAKICKKAYNILQKKRKLQKHERRQIKKGNNCNDCGRSVASCDFNCRHDISADINKRSEAQRSRTERTDSNLQGT